MLAANSGSPKFNDRQFWVTATADVSGRVKKGDHVLIDPDRAPVAGKHVLSGGRLGIWDGASIVDGVAVQVEFDLELHDGGAVGFYSPEPDVP